LQDERSKLGALINVLYMLSGTPLVHSSSCLQSFF
jgi:hypothetical protein